MTEKTLSNWTAFGAELRRQRQQAGLTVRGLAAQIPFAASTVGKVERATRAPKRDFVDATESVLGTRGTLLRYWTEAKKGEADPEWFRRVVTSEQEATDIRTWNPLLVPGAFQTEAYARTVFLHGRPVASQSEIDRLVDLRLKRSKAILSKGGPAMWAIIDEAALRRVFDSPAPMSEQLTRLEELADTRTVKLQVFPMASACHSGLGGAFRVISFSDRRSLLYVDHGWGGQLMDDAEEVRRAIAIWSELQAWALPPPQSRQLIADIKKGLQ
ncbi:helix-turn-helix domain-containing protein [Nocardiopsis halophila]|uniref:helix-turn-helix domain-containing protein n=1 Tax=Nocardiopsis halophila TaxID=141692 RepID=UPI0004757D20|nr:helix-turn-helix transcriptional regulator [Nocardiopsis halophila]